MKKYSKVTIVVAILIFGASTTISGCFGIPKIGGEEQRAAGASKESVINQQNDLVKKYMAASLEVTKAQELMADAFDLKELMEGIRADIAALESGNVMSKDEIEKQRARTEAVQKIIDEKMEEQTELSAKGKECYAKSLVPYFQGVLLSKEIVPEAKNCLEGAKSQISSAPLTEKAKVKKTFDVALYLAPKVGPDLKNMVSTGTKYVTYAKHNKVKVPKNATDALGDDF